MGCTGEPHIKIRTPRMLPLGGRLERSPSGHPEFFLWGSFQAISPWQLLLLNHQRGGQKSVKDFLGADVLQDSKNVAR